MLRRCAGCQIVALNMQVKGDDGPLWMNQGKFMANGGCGDLQRPNDRPRFAILVGVLRVVETVSGFGTIESVLESHGPRESFELSQVRIGLEVTEL